MVSCSTIAQIISLILTFMGAFIFALPSLFSNNDKIKKIARSHAEPNPYDPLGTNPYLIDALLLDRKMTRYGLIFISVGLAFGLISIFLIG
jgi:hypothetical protein